MPNLRSEVEHTDNSVRLKTDPTDDTKEKNVLTIFVRLQTTISELGRLQRALNSPSCIITKTDISVSEHQNRDHFRKIRRS